MTSIETPKFRRIILACDRNESRSIMGEVVMVTKVREMGIEGLQVQSAGISVVTGIPMSDHVFKVLKRHGYNPQDFANVRPDGSKGARRLSMVLSADTDFAPSDSLLLCYSQKQIVSIRNKIKAYTLPDMRVELIHKYARIGKEIKDPAKQIGNRPCLDWVPYGLAERLGIIDINNLDYVNMYHERLLLKTEAVVDGVLKRILEQ